MASVTSLDADVRNLRLSRYTPQAANEARAWIETALGESLPSGDLLDVLRDGVALCKLANLATQSHAGAIKFKASAMPFIQMENISHFLRACELPPLSMPAHDRFLTVDLFEQKDPAQVLQCLSAFSRQANRINPNKFPNAIGPKKAGGVVSPNSTGRGTVATNGGGFRRPASPVKHSSALSNPPAQAMDSARTGGSSHSQTSSKQPAGPVSSWSSKTDEVSTAPAWNIHQYGYMGGASQGNQGVSFGARRQITSQPPSVPSLAEKEKVRKEKEAELERQRLQNIEERQRRDRAVAEEEARARAEEEKRWEEETRKAREEERQRVEQQKREWAEQERRWQEEEKARRVDEDALNAGISKRPPEKPRVPSSSILRGQTLAEYQREQAAQAGKAEVNVEKDTARDDRQLEEARERERQYQIEREERLRKESERSRPSTARSEDRSSSVQEGENSWVGDERELLRQQWQKGHQEATASTAPRSTPNPFQRPLPSQPGTTPAPSAPFPSRPQPAPTSNSTSSPQSRPLPTQASSHDPPDTTPTSSNRTDTFLTSNPAPANPTPRISASHEAGDTSHEQAQLRDARLAGQQKTKAGAWASKSLLEREMERERERQKEWEANQQDLKDRPRDATQGTGQGQSWDVNQYGFVGGDSQNRGSSVGSGINFGGRRQIIGPRPKPN